MGRFGEVLSDRSLGGAGEIRPRRRNLWAIWAGALRALFCFAERGIDNLPALLCLDHGQHARAHRLEFRDSKRFGEDPSVLRNGPPDTFKAFRRLRSRAPCRQTMKKPRCGAKTRRDTACLASAIWSTRSRRVTRCALTWDNPMTRPHVSFSKSALPTRLHDARARTGEENAPTGL